MNRVAFASAMACSCAGLACAALIDIKDLSAPAADASTSEASGDASAVCGADAAQNLVGNIAAGAIAVDDTHVYFANTIPSRATNFVARCARCDCANQPQELARGAYVPVAVAVDGDSLYFADGSETGGIHRVDKRTGASHVSIAAVSPTAVAVDATHVYFGAVGSTSAEAGVYGNGIWRVEKARFDDAHVERLFADLFPFGLAVDTTHVYWSTARELGTAENVASIRCLTDAGPFSGTVRRIPKAGGSPQTLASGQACAVSLALDDENVFFTTLGGSASDGKVQAVGKGGGAVRLLADKQLGPLSISSAGTDLAWTTANSQGTVQLCATSDCPATRRLVADTEAAPASVVIGDTAIYWGNQGVLGAGQGALRFRAR